MFLAAHNADLLPNTNHVLLVPEDTFPAQIDFRHLHCSDLLMWGLDSVSKSFPGNIY
jgi:hypothetical protein